MLVVLAIFSIKLYPLKISKPAENVPEDKHGGRERGGGGVLKVPESL